MIDAAAVVDIVWACAWGTCLVIFVTTVMLMIVGGDIAAIVRAWRQP